MRGVAVRNSDASTLIITGRAHVSASSYLLIQSFTNPTTFSANQVFVTNVGNAHGGVNWIRYSDNGTNRTWYSSTDGVTFNVFKTEGRTTFLTADQIGVYLDAFDGNSSITVFHWKEE